MNKENEYQVLTLDKCGLQGGGVLEFDLPGVDIKIIGGVEEVDNGDSRFQEDFFPCQAVID
jgi:hypothetical protein